MENIYARTQLLIGADNLTKLKTKKVAVFGIGGVGSFAAEALARTGIGSLFLIDGDTVCPTNINRQIHANQKTIGQPKVKAMQERIKDINPEIKVISHQAFYSPETASGLLQADYDYVIDAIDMVSAKVDLIARSIQMNLNIISSMGAGNKLDPTKFQIADIFETSVCPLARVMRKELRTRGIKELKVVYSKEKPIKLLDLPSEARPISGSISFVPSAAGLIIASQVFKDLLLSK